MLSVFIYNPSQRHDSDLTLSLSVGGSDAVDRNLKEEFVKLFDKHPRKSGLNNVEYLHLYQVLPTLRRILRHRGADNALFDLLSVVDARDSMGAVTIDYLV